MASRTLGDLPLEIVFDICELLYHARFSSLVSFARSNKAFYAVATTFLSRTLRVSGNDSGTVALDVQEHFRRLRRDDAFEHVRHLTIVGHYGAYRSEDYRLSIPPPTRDVEIDYRFNTFGFFKHMRNGRPEWEPNDIWRPLVDLIKQLPHLADLMYHRPDLLPPCLLEALHEHQPRCRLHIDDFQLHSLDSERPDLNSHELMVATSPCLYSITLPPALVPARWLPVNAVYALQCIVGRLAPNLRMVRSPPGRVLSSSSGPDGVNSSSHPLWKLLDTMPQADRGLPGSLHYLHLYPSRKNYILQGQALADWSLHISFAFLQTLRLDGLVAEDALDFLARAPHGFPSLETLALKLKKSSLGGADSINRYYDLARQFISTLRGLNTLKIEGWHHRIDLSTILGSELRTLSLRSYRGEHLTAQDVVQIRERCPFLTNLSLPILRSRGDASEIAVYKELGALPRLQTLSLVMDALLPPRTLSGHPPPDPSFDDYDRQPSGYDRYLNGHFRHVFINGAMDANLALDIFETISRAKLKDNSTRLQKLYIWFSRDSYSAPENHLGRYSTAFRYPWLVERSLRDDSTQPLVVRELDRMNRRVQERIQDDDEAAIGSRRSSGNLDSIFRRIWPERSEGSHWRGDWHSFPLSSHTTTELHASPPVDLPDADMRRLCLD
ncbi:hypothetical protein F5Y05DRAFT_368432 [Hypoxylon sp. FL0543]|nr:hypothetical protein F5Y05DRAFT_368432 [Hypoxylon sp. FL0543]